jgi:putative intracellular protease/amidase
MAKALLPIAEGTEEMEAVITADILRRAGWQLDICAAGKDETIEGAERANAMRKELLLK